MNYLNLTVHGISEHLQFNQNTFGHFASAAEILMARISARTHYTTRRTQWKTTKEKKNERKKGLSINEPKLNENCTL